MTECPVVKKVWEALRLAKSDRFLHCGTLCFCCISWVGKGWEAVVPRHFGTEAFAHGESPKSSSLGKAGEMLI